MFLACVSVISVVSLFLALSLCVCGLLVAVFFFLGYVCSWSLSSMCLSTCAVCLLCVLVVCWLFMVGCLSVWCCYSVCLCLLSLLAWLCCCLGLLVVYVFLLCAAYCSSRCAPRVSVLLVGVPACFVLLIFVFSFVFLCVCPGSVCGSGFVAVCFWGVAWWGWGLGLLVFGFGVGVLFCGVVVGGVVFLGVVGVGVVLWAILLLLLLLLFFCLECGFGGCWAWCCCW